MPFLWMRKRARTSLGLREDQEKTRALGGLSPHSTEVRTNSLRRLCLVPGFLSEVKRQKKKTELRNKILPEEKGWEQGQ